jgi:hypothetical protein
MVRGQSVQTAQLLLGCVGLKKVLQMSEFLALAVPSQ